MEKATPSPRPIKSDHNYESKAAKKDVHVNNSNIVVEELRDDYHDHLTKKQGDEYGTSSCTDAASDYENGDDLDIDDADDDDKQKRFKQNLHLLMSMRSARASPLRARAAIYNSCHHNNNSNSQLNAGAASDQEMQQKPLDGTKSSSTSGSNNYSKANMTHMMMNVRSSRPNRGLSSLATSSSIVTDGHNHHHHRHHHRQQPALSNPSSTEASPRSTSDTCNTKSAQLHRDEYAHDAKPHNVINDNPLYSINTNVTDVNCDNSGGGTDNNNKNRSNNTLMQKQGADDHHDHHELADEVQLSTTSSRSTSRHHNSITDDLIAKARADENKDGSHLMRVLADFLEEFQFGASDDNGEYASWVQDPKSLPLECRHSRQLAGQLRRLADVFEKENILQGRSGCDQQADAGKDHKLIMFEKENILQGRSGCDQQADAGKDHKLIMSNCRTLVTGRGKSL